MFFGEKWFVMVIGSKEGDLVKMIAKNSNGKIFDLDLPVYTEKVLPN